MNELVPGCTTPYSIPDVSAQGMHLMQAAVQLVHESDDPESGWQDLENGEENIKQEVDNRSV